MKELLKKISLRTIIMISCSSFIIVIIAASAAFYFTGTRHMEFLVKENAKNLTVQAATNMNRKFDQLSRSVNESITDSYLFSKMNQNILNNEAPISAKNYTRLSNMIQTFVNQNKQDIIVIILMLSDNTIVMTASYYNELYRYKQPDYQYLYENFSNTNLSWVYKNTTSQFIANDMQVPSIGMLQMLGDANSDVHGFLYAGISDDTIKQDLSGYHVTNNNIFDLTYNETPLFNYDNILRNFSLENSYRFQKTLDIDSLSVISVIPKKEIFLSSQRFSTLLLTEALFAIGFCIILFILITKLISAPAEHLARQLNSVEKLTQLKSVKSTGGKDFVQITDAINRLFYRIDSLIKSLTIEVQSRKDAELKILYAQINPHFLYNTLDSIGQLCDINELDLAKEMVYELSDFYRIGVSKGEEMILLRDELLHVTSYLSILQTRFADFNYNIYIPEELKTALIPKIILQPLAENALYHGIRGNTADGIITISAITDSNHLILTVSDNGIGIDDKNMESLKNSLNNRCENNVCNKVYGLKNVHQRIQLIYGNQYGLSISSIPEEYTQVTVTLPLNFHIEENR